MAREKTKCEVLHQNFLNLDLATEKFDGVFANATLFHVPKQELPQVLNKLWAAIKPDGVLFSSNPRGDNQEGWNSDRYGSYHNLEKWTDALTAIGFELLEHYYRPPGMPRQHQPWLATVWRRPKYKEA